MASWAWAWTLPRLKARTVIAANTPTAHRQIKWEELMDFLTMRFLLQRGKDEKRMLVTMQPAMLINFIRSEKIKKAKIC
jgi:hypothetical protein